VFDNARDHRTREQAFRLANMLAARARAQPGQFGEIVREYSEHRDAEQGGDIGVWSVCEPSLMARELEALAKLEVGAISEPIDTFLGVVVLKRVAVQPREAFAMAAVRIRFDPTLPDSHPDSKETQKRIAQNTAREIAADTTRFEVFQQQLCCLGIERWTEGRGLPGLTAALADLKFGEVSAQAVESDWNFVIPRRLNPAGVPPLQQVLFRLPRPARPDFAHLLRVGSETSLRALVSSMEVEGLRNLPLREPDRSTANKIHHVLLQRLLATREPTERIVTFER
jgi:hypothetical protein